VKWLHASRPCSAIRMVIRTFLSEMAEELGRDGPVKMV
jgi:hypothetical protein